MKCHCLTGDMRMSIVTNLLLLWSMYTFVHHVALKYSLNGMIKWLMEVSLFGYLFGGRYPISCNNEQYFLFFFCYCGKTKIIDFACNEIIQEKTGPWNAIFITADLDNITIISIFHFTFCNVNLQKNVLFNVTMLALLINFMILWSVNNIVLITLQILFQEVTLLQRHVSVGVILGSNFFP